MKQSRFPKGWDESKVSSVLSHYENQSEDDAVSDDEAALEDRTQTLMEIWSLLSENLLPDTIPDTYSIYNNSSSLFTEQAQHG